MRRLLRSAYGLSDLQITGPDWLDSDQYDLVAKSPQGVPDTELMPMLQALLKERFNLSVHRDLKEMPVFEMVVAKGGLKIWQFDPARPVPRPPLPANLEPAQWWRPTESSRCPSSRRTLDRYSPPVGRSPG